MVSQSSVHKQERNKGAIDEILSELLVFEDKPSPIFHQSTAEESIKNAKQEV
jgi:hypothetical protein